MTGPACPVATRTTSEITC